MVLGLPEEQTNWEGAGNDGDAWGEDEDDKQGQI